MLHRRVSTVSGIGAGFRDEDMPADGRRLWMRAAVFMHRAEVAEFQKKRWRKRRALLAFYAALREIRARGFRIRGW